MDASVLLPRRDFLILEKPVFISNAYAQAAGGDTASSLMGLLPLLLMFVVLYFVMIRPQMKRQKEHKVMIEASIAHCKGLRLSVSYQSKIDLGRLPTIQ